MKKTWLEQILGYDVHFHMHQHLPSYKNVLHLNLNLPHFLNGIIHLPFFGTVHYHF